MICDSGLDCKNVSVIRYDPMIIMTIGYHHKLKTLDKHTALLKSMVLSSEYP